MRSMLDLAITIAVRAHAEQVDLNGEPYILHPLRVMTRMKTDDERIVAALHDVVEDGICRSLDRLRGEGFAEHILEAVAALTRRDGEDYEAYIRRAAENPLAKAVKLADLVDNMDPGRMPPEPTDRDVARLAKYDAAFRFLSGAKI